MSAAWDRVHDRYRLTQQVLTDVRRRGVHRVMSRWDAEIEAAFGDIDTFLAHVQRRWSTALIARVDSALEQGVGDLTEARRVAARDLAQVDPATPLLLDAYAMHPVVEAGLRRREGMFASFGSPAHRQRAAPPVRRSVRVRQRRRCPARALMTLLVR